MSGSGRFTVEQEKDAVFAQEVFILRDNQVGSSSRVIPALGNNLMAFVAGLPDGRRLDVVLGPPPGEAPGRASRWGNPILFPFPNRVRDARYNWQGKQYQLVVNTPEGNHIHGLVRDRPWHVDDAGGSAQGASIRCSFAGDNFPEVMRQYPFPFVLTVSYTLNGNNLRLDAQARNVGSEAMPMGFGIHPYFRAPMESAGTRADCIIYVPSGEMWEQDAEKLPTGRKVAASPELDFTTPRPLDDVYIDHVYTDVIREKGEARCWMRDPRAAAQVNVRFGTEFPILVVLAPADRATVAFEPYTCVTNAINLAAEGRDDTGLIVLPPGSTWNGSVRFEVAKAQERSQR